jgi:hypothetical protein
LKLSTFVKEYRKTNDFYRSSILVYNQMSTNPNHFVQVHVSPESHHFVNTHFPAINHFFSTDNTSYEIFKESTGSSNQNGVYRILHLLGKEDRKLYTVTFLMKNGHSSLY